MTAPCVQDIPHRAESTGQIALGQADHRAGVTDLTRAGQLIAKRRERARLAGHPEARLVASKPAGHLTRQSVRPLEPRLQAFGRHELPERLVVAAATGLAISGRLVQQQA